jgi:hypothetical protein
MGTSRSERWIRSTTTASVLLVAVIAAVLSYRHMHELVLKHGEDLWAAALIPLSVDGTIIAASMSLLLASRYGRSGELLPWTLLVISGLANLGANVAVAEPTLVGRVIAAWPSFALIGAYEMLMSQIRRSAAHRAGDRYAAQEAGHAGTDADTRDDQERGGDLQNEAGPAADRNGGCRSLQRSAWRWALENRAPDGALPSGVAIARAFSRSPRWGRLVKNAGARRRTGRWTRDEGRFGTALGRGWKNDREREAPSGVKIFHAARAPQVRNPRRAWNTSTASPLAGSGWDCSLARHLGGQRRSARPATPRPCLTPWGAATARTCWTAR